MVFSGHKNATLLILLPTLPLLLARLSFAFSNSEVVETIESNPSRIILELKPYEVNFDEIFVNGERYELPRIEGYQWMTEPGKPRLPVKGILLGIPRNAAPTIQILESHSIPLGPQNLYPSPKLVLTEDEQGQHLAEQFWLDKDFYSQNSFYPSKLVEITSISRLRHQWVARLEIHPLQYNPVTKELRKVDRFKVALLFNEDQQLKDRSIKPLSPEEFGPFETIYKNLLFNYQTARSWRLPEFNRYQTPGLKEKLMDWYHPTNIYYKLFIEEKGLYRLDVTYLESIGIDVGSIDPITLKVYHKGRELPLYLGVQQASKFSPGDYVEFYGQGNSGDSTYFDPYTDTNVYWLTWGGEPGLRMRTRSSLMDSITEVNEYLERIHLEQDNFYYHGDNSLDLINTEQVSGEGWVWRFFYPGESEIIAIPVTNIAESTVPCRLKIKLRGTTLDPISPDHHAKVFLNDNFLGELYFDGTEDNLFEISFPSLSLREQENRLVLTSIGDTGAERDQFYLDWLELEYPRQLVAQNDYLEFTASNETAKFSLWGFSDPDIQLFDLTTSSIIERTTVSTGQKFFFKAISAGYNDGNFAKLYVNSQEVVSYGYRGHNLAVVDEVSGQLIETRYFDTHLSTAEADSLAHYIQNLPQGRIVLAALRDEGSRNMTEAAYIALESLGSHLIRRVGYRDSWALIGRKGAPVGSVPEELKVSGSGTASVKDTLILTGSGQSYYLVFGDTLRQTKTYLAVAQDGMKYPVAARLDTNANLTSTENGADLIIISHKKFLTSAQRLAQYRASHNGLRIKVVDVEDIYDEFNYGLLNPQAIKDFLKYTFSHWQSPPPSYLLLFGDASWDFKKNSATSVKENFVPSYGSPVSDNWFVCLDGPSDFLPEMLVGRIPVETENEAEVVVDKIVAYDNTPPGAWKKNILFITGGFNKGEQSLFMNQSKFIIDQFVTPPPASCRALRINKTTEGYFEGEKKKDILDAINSGTLWVNFIGHAGSNTWDLMFHHPDLEELTNQDKYPFVTSMTCHTGRFAEPELTSFGEHFLRAENKGAIAFWGTSGWGYIFQDNELSTNLFRAVLKDTFQILGEATTLAKMKLWQEYGDNNINVSIIHQYTLMGDPVTDLALPDRPDLTLGPQDVIFTPAVPAEADSSVSIKLRVHNWGLATSDSVQIEVLDVKADQGVVPIGSTIVLPPLGLVDSLIVNWRIADQAGQHTVRILLDPDNEIDEENETNNSQDFPLYIYSSKLTISRPIEFQLVSPQEVTLQVNNPAVTSRDVLPPSFQFEVDTTHTFDSPFLVSSPPISKGKIVTRWQPTSLIDATTYFWRCRTMEEGSDFGKWVSSSFATQSGLEGHFWRQKHQQQFVRNNLEQTQLLSHGVQIQPRPFVLRIESAGFHDGNFTRILVNFQPAIEPHRGHNLVAISPNTGQVLLARAFDTLLSQDEANAMADIINELEDGTYVLIGIMDEGSYRMTEAAYQALESIGSKLCRNVGWRDSWAIIGIKGALIGSVKEQHTPAFQGIAVVQDTLINYYPQGTLTSPPIGPATAWKSVSWTEDLSAFGTDITLDVLGFNKKSALWDTLLADLTNNSNEDLTSISAQMYPLIKLRANLTNNDGLHTPILKDWSVAYEPVPDLAISPQVVSISADTVMEGEPIQVTAEIHNVGLRVADSIRVRFLYSDPIRLRVPFGTDQLLTNIDVNSFKSLTQTWQSKGHRGNIQLFIEIDPEDQITELYEFNNVFSQTVFIKTDTIRPELQVTFDGKEILPGDMISSHPRIVATIRDNSPLAIDDTSNVLLLLNGKKITYLGNEQVLQLLPSSQVADPGLKARILFTPTLSDGHYSLVILVSDASGNAINYQQEFQVISEFKLLQVMNYPNPFASHTSFTYYLTQPAAQVSIKIYTLAGRLIRNLDSASSEVGFNQQAWDGRDEDGDELANGVYLYKIIAKAGGQQDSVVEKLVVMR